MRVELALLSNLLIFHVHLVLVSEVIEDAEGREMDQENAAIAKIEADRGANEETGARIRKTVTAEERGTTVRSILEDSRLDREDPTHQRSLPRRRRLQRQIGSEPVTRVAWSGILEKIVLN